MEMAKRASGSLHHSMGSFQMTGDRQGSSDPSTKKISVFGLGYVGLPVAAVLASRGYNVLGVDVSPAIVDVINGGNIHIVEPDLDMIVRASVSGGRLRATLTP